MQQDCPPLSLTLLPSTLRDTLFKITSPISFPLFFPVTSLSLSLHSLDYLPSPLSSPHQIRIPELGGHGKYNTEMPRLQGPPDHPKEAGRGTGRGQTDWSAGRSITTTKAPLV
ncbi:hypothetical protein E2C01_005929 [Portunus trituberculatus]|uniref:Uncharacterized protein n=1 Tax=Portunus trituberculatus TaxID=210409 RepID=A0A5B7CXW6_PORTR|nr:hypothetical protein [Portunus trituberculatus]